MNAQLTDQDSWKIQIPTVDKTSKQSNKNFRFERTDSSMNNAWLGCMRQLLSKLTTIC
jgi:hypothetical protein